MECQDALEETVVSAEFTTWIRAGAQGQSCPDVPADAKVSCRAEAFMSHTDLELKGELCQEAVMQRHMFKRAKQLVDTVE